MHVTLILRTLVKGVTNYDACVCVKYTIYMLHNLLLAYKSFAPINLHLSEKVQFKNLVLY